MDIHVMTWNTNGLQSSRIGGSRRMLLRRDLQRSVVGDIDILTVQEHKIAQPFGNLMRVGFRTFGELASGQHSRSCVVSISEGPRLLSSVRHHGTLVAGRALYVAIDIDVLHLKELGFAQPSWAASKLKQGFGDAVCSVLDGLTDLALNAQRFRFCQPIYSKETSSDDDVEILSFHGDHTKEVCLLPDSKQIVSDTHIMEKHGSSPRTSEENLGRHNAGRNYYEESKVQAERLACQSRVTMGSDGKDWRTHLKEAQQLHCRRISWHYAPPHWFIHLPYMPLDVLAPFSVTHVVIEKGMPGGSCASPLMYLHPSL
ncbi:hypothetical protein L7F22_033770 [Adiantum nelumboides]|nr:hypothetical protein [Adiantum nelumboides]